MNSSRIISVSLAILLCFLTGCGRNPTRTVQRGTLDIDPSVEVGKALNGYKFFKSASWNSYETSQGRETVEFIGLMDFDAFKDTKIRGQLISADVVDKARTVDSDFAVEYVAKFELSKKDNSFKVAYSGIKARGIKPSGSKRDLLVIDDNDLIALRCIYVNEPEAYTGAWLFEAYKIASIRDDQKIAAIDAKLANLKPEEEKELTLVEARLDQTIAEIRTEIDSLKNKKSRIEKQIDSIKQQCEPFKKEFDELKATRTALSDGYDKKTQAARESSNNLDQVRLQILGSAAKLVNDAIVAQAITADMVRPNGENPDCLTTKGDWLRTADNCYDNIFYHSAGELQMPTEPNFGDVATSNNGTLVYKESAGRDYLIFELFPKTLKDQKVRQAFVSIYKKYKAFVSGAKTNATEVKSLDDSKQVALRNWEYVNGTKFEALQKKVQEFEIQIDQITVELSKCSADLSSKESLVNKPRSEQILPFRAEVTAKFAERRRLLVEEKTKIIQEWETLTAKL